MDGFHIASEFIVNPDDIKVSEDKNTMEIRCVPEMFEALVNYLRLYCWELTGRIDGPGYFYLTFKKAHFHVDFK